MADQDQPIEAQTVARGAGRLKAPEAPATALTLVLAPRASTQEPALSLFGFYNIDVTTAGRHGSVLPGAIFVALVERDTALVHVRDLSNDDDVPALYVPGAPPSITREDDPGDLEGMSESGHFTVDLPHHLGLPDGRGLYDGFLWLEDTLSDMTPGVKPDENGAETITQAAPPALAVAVDIAATGAAETLAIHARPGAHPIAIIAMAPASRRIGWVSFPAGARAAAKAADLIPGWTPGERVLAVAISGGVRSTLYDSASR